MANDTNTKKTYLLFDIDSSSIGVLLFEKNFLGAKGTDFFYQQIFSERRYLPNRGEGDFESFLRSTEDTLNQLALRAFAHTKKTAPLDSVYLNLSAPWISNQKNILHFEKEREFFYHDGFMKEILSQQQEKKSHLLRDFRSYDDLELIGQEVIGRYANGYRVKNLEGRKVKDLDIHTLNSFISPASKRMFFDVIERHFHRSPVLLSNLLTNYRALRDLFPKEEHLLSLDVSAEITEIVLIEKGEIVRIASFPIGSRAIKRYLAREMKVSLEKASSFLDLFGQKKLEEHFEQHFKKVLDQAFLVWFKSLYNFLSELSAEHLLPQVFSLVAEPDVEKFLQEWILDSDELAGLAGFGKQLRVLDIRLAFFDQLKERSDEIQDSSLLAALSFLEQENVIK